MAKKAAGKREGQGLLLPDIVGPASTGGVGRVHATTLPVNAKPLFLPKLIAAVADDERTRARREAARPAFLKWIGDLNSGLLQLHTETQIDQGFLKLLAGLGYVAATDAPAGAGWSLAPKWTVPGAGIVDVALGRFSRDETGAIRAEPLVMVELKGADKDLDRKGSDGRTPVQQAWDYLNATEAARWALVTNFVEVRLYSKDRTSRHLHQVRLRDLADPDRFAAFFAVFNADSLLETGAVSAQGLMDATAERQETVSERLYEEYSDRRAELIVELQALGVAELDQAIAAAQRLLDRILFIAFAEDRGLVKAKALEHAARAETWGLTPWGHFQYLFRAIDRGDERHDVPRYNGALFKPDPVLDDLEFQLDSEKWPEVFKSFGGYDFRDEVTVDVLGRIFERSITDIEKIKEQGGVFATTDAPRDRRKPGQRKKQGVFYTDAYIVEYLVDAALRPLWDQQRAELAARHGLAGVVPDPPPAAFTRDLLAWLDTVTLCDPACGSGAFLVAAYEWFETARCDLLKDLKNAEPTAPEADGDPDDWRGRSAPLILKNNLHGVDLSPESVEIAQLSLWVRTARRGQLLTDLSANVVCGNSVVDDIAVDPKRAFDWKSRFPRVFERGGFDAVVGNPPYVRQEHLSPIKPYLEKTYKTYHGMADLYVYFYEKGMDLLKPGGRLAYVVTNKWMKAGYGEPLRRFFGAETWIETVVDFGHAKQFFKDADVFPCFLVARRPTDEPRPKAVRVCVIPREQVRLDDLKSQIDTDRIEIEEDRFRAETWNLEPRSASDLFDKIRNSGMPLFDFVGAKPCYGVKTGYNEAFLIDTSTRNSIISKDTSSKDIIKPYLRGQDIKRWNSEWLGQWMIFTKRGFNIEDYPAIKGFLLDFKESLTPKPLDWDGEWAGRKAGNYKWYEIQDPVDYWELFESPKLVIQRIAFHSRFSFDNSNLYVNDSAIIVPCSDYWTLACLNSPVLWWYMYRLFPHKKDEALAMDIPYVQSLPIPSIGESIREKSSQYVERLLHCVKANQGSRRDLLDWLQVEHEVAEPNMKLQNPLALDSDAFVAEVKKARGKGHPLSAAGVRGLREEHGRSIAPAQALAVEARGLEASLSALVNAAYGLTPAEVRLLWDTAPPRMPIPRPATLDAEDM